LDASYGTVFRDLLNLKCVKVELEGGVGVILRIIEFLVIWETRLELSARYIYAWSLRLTLLTELITQRASDAACPEKRKTWTFT
jgi:hypothetical protein